MRFLPDLFVLGAQFGANRSEWTAAKLSELFIFFHLILDDSIAVPLETLERRHLGGKNLVHQATLLIPVIFKGGGGEIGLRFEGVVEASLVHAGAVADVIDTDGAVTTLPDESYRGTQKSLFGITLALHEGNLVDRLV